MARICTKRDKLPAVIELLGKLLREPAFAAGPLDELRHQWLAGIERQRKDPDGLVANRLARHGNPYPRGDLRYAALAPGQVPLPVPGSTCVGLHDRRLDG